MKLYNGSRVSVGVNSIESEESAGVGHTRRISVESITFYDITWNIIKSEWVNKIQVAGYKFMWCHKQCQEIPVFVQLTCLPPQDPPDCTLSLRCSNSPLPPPPPPRAEDRQCAITETDSSTLGWLPSSHSCVCGVLAPVEAQITLWSIYLNSIVGTNCFYLRCTHGC